MVQGILKWLRTVYKQTIASIAFIPALIAIFFLLLSFFMVQFDFSEFGKAIKSNAYWLTLKDASTARSIISAIVSGIISLTVFSFSMVMILLNQAASQMSNRVIDKLIGNRFQQTVLGFYIGTIVYALFLLSTIREINSGIYVPAISTYFLIGLTVIDIFFFIYFLHYVTQSVKYETIIHRIHDTTRRSMEKTCVAKSDTEGHSNLNECTIITAYKSGIYQGFVHEGLLSFCQKEDIVISFLYPSGTSVFRGNPLLEIKGHKSFPETFEDDLSKFINIYRGQEIKSNYYYGLKQLMEVAVKALSPGINDPGTAILSLQSLGELFSFRLQNHPVTHIRNKEGIVRVISKERSFSEMFKDCIYPIWDYGKADRLVLKELLHILSELKRLCEHPLVNELLELVQKAIAKQEQERG
ncbi:DUF2254 domain-containing protein [Desertivirga xinjiangensis]|uniref:DUF2254 domain-containing protein n=1 Tax=Desertivirga xinjiangensis TaxID=539206 RepID=UPI0021087503|nr:DUF2254 domain-containing protein [Pedobacter xinjiangensis]